MAALACADPLNAPVNEPAPEQPGSCTGLEPSGHRGHRHHGGDHSGRAARKAARRGSGCGSWSSLGLMVSSPRANGGGGARRKRVVARPGV